MSANLVSIGALLLERLLEVLDDLLEGLDLDVMRHDHMALEGDQGHVSGVAVDPAELADDHGVYFQRRV
jgi:hypothetical protein